MIDLSLLPQNIVKNCDTDDPADTSVLTSAFYHMTQMAEHINEMKRRHEHAVRIQEIQSQLEDYVGEDLTRLGELVLEVSQGAGFGRHRNEIGGLREGGSLDRKSWC